MALTPHSSSYPTVCIANAIDTLRPIIQRAPTAPEKTRITKSLFPQQDQAVFWRPLDKLIISEQPIEGFQWLGAFLGASHAQNISPKHPSGNLFRDVVLDSALQAAIVQWSGAARCIQLIVHTTTQELWPMVQFLRQQLKLTVLLPESCSDQAFRDRLDSKSGFRQFASDHGFSVGRARIANGRCCATRAEAAIAIADLLATDRPAIAKPDRGEASVGLNVFQPGTSGSILRDTLGANSYFGDEPIVIEEYIQGDELTFPSVEYFVPMESGQAPYLTYACSMLFSDMLELCGNFVSPEHRHTPWHEPLCNAGLRLAQAMQDAGFVGYFDIDAVALPNGDSIMLDLNPRRTGATHVHEFASATLGAGYQRTHTVGAIDLYGQRPVQFEEVLSKLGSSIRSPLTATAACMPCELTGLQEGRISLMLWGPTAESVLSLQQTAQKALQPLGFPLDGT
ncbi:hypothetical protein [Chromobacterium haemolyticum]|uniref:hypothetical protein n=1 Tax=Chromobacterium haemolyticum TaxID=394935 RepID=UPI0009DAF139|nr:hypothetical protein [Chromobacterium haemolyticum]OQS34051.1 hypothetical protein B0T39_20175 [Chromobacterium haemolyticum]